MYASFTNHGDTMKQHNAMGYIKKKCLCKHESSFRDLKGFILDEAFYSCPLLLDYS